MANLSAAARTKARSFYVLAKTQRLAWSCAVVVGLFLVLHGHVPIFPVMAGCVLAVTFSATRAWPRLKPKPLVRGGR